MKKPRTLILVLLTLMLVVGIPICHFVRAVQKEQATHTLIAAIKANDTPAALVALKAGADPNTRNDGLDKPPTVREILEGYLDDLRHPAPNTPDERLTPLLLLCLDEDCEDNPKLVKALLDAGADPNATGWDGLDSALMLAADRRTPQTFRLLLSSGGNVHLKNIDGGTALHRASHKGDGAMIQLLLNAGADINATDNEGDTPLHIACFAGNLETASTLMRQHASITVRDEHGKTPLDAARSRDSIYRIGAYVDPGSEIVIGKSLRQAGAKTGKELDVDSQQRRKP